MKVASLGDRDGRLRPSAPHRSHLLFSVSKGLENVLQIEVCLFSGRVFDAFGVLFADRCAI